MTRVYLSNIRSTWPISRQEARLDADLPDWRKGAVYLDEPTGAKRRAHTPGVLASRATMLRPTSRRSGETVSVASLSVLAWTLGDFLSVLASLAKRNATLVALDERLTIPPGATAAAIAAAGHAFESAVRRVGDAGKSGGKSSGERRAARAKAACDAMAPFWCLPSSDYPTAELLEKFKVSRPTALMHLGKRADAQRRHQAGLAQAERNSRRKQADE